MIKELLGHAHIGVNVYSHVRLRLRLQRDVIDTLSTALDGPTVAKAVSADGDEPSPCAALVR